MFIMNYDIDKSYDVNKIKKLKENLICDGGFLESSSSNDVNIVSTFAVFKLNSFLGDSLYIEENKEYVKKLEKNVGIYSYSLDDDSVSLNTIWYGNIISHSWVGFENGIKY